MKHLILFLILTSLSFGQSSLLLLFDDDENPQPFSQDALFILDGTIITEGENKYFQDKSGNNRHFLITNYDFDSDWTKGMPYKSAATISAPAGDTILIQNDVNFYLYAAADSIPNQIPVVSLFQNIDYENRLFTRHAAQDTNSVGVETYEPRVMDVVLYNSVKSGNDLTKCQTYYSVPEKTTTNVKWVAKSGNDTTGDGTEANPYLTIDKGVTSAGSGHLVYVKTGEYVESAVNNYLGIFKTITITAVGAVHIKSVATNYNIYVFDGGGITLNNIIVGNDTSVTEANIISTLAADFNFNNCWLKNAPYNLNLNAATSINLESNIFSNASNRILRPGVNTSLTISETFSTLNKAFVIQSGAGAGETEIKYNKLFILSIQYAGNIKHNIQSNYFSDAYFTKTAAVSSDNDQLLFSYNTLDSVASYGLRLENDFYDTQIIYNIFRSKFAGTVNLSIKDQSNLKVNSNILIGYNAGIYIPASTSLIKSVEISGNYISAEIGNTSLQIGLDASDTTGFNTTGGVISKNYIIGLDNLENHGVVVFNQDSVTIKWNWSEGYSFGYITKVRGTDLTDAPIIYNVSVGNFSGLQAKGGQNQVIANNTVINATTNGFYSSTNVEDGTDYSLNTQFKNNIIIDTGEERTFNLIKIDAGNTIVSDYNIFYSANNSIQFDSAGTVLTFAQWQARGHDLNSIVLTTEQFNSLFTDYANGDYSLADGSVAIGAGEDLGEAYDEGLDASTDWGSTTRVPNVVTKQQGEAWDVGAYIK